MNPIQKKAFEREIGLAKSFMRQRQYEDAFGHLERAHVLGQARVLPHVRSHWLMLVVAAARRDAGGVVGQAVRIVLGTLGSAIGKVPTGNTGGTNVSMFERMPIAPDLSAIMEGQAH